MARKKAQVATKPVSASTAAIFQGSETVADVDEKIVEKEEPKKVEPVKQNVFTEEGDYTNSHFIMKALYKVQDHLNENMTLLHFVQLCAFIYVLDLLYIKIEKFPVVLDTWQVIGFNILGVASGIVLNFVKNKGTNSTLPEFNQLYSIVFPLLYNIMNYDKNNFLANLCLNYFIADNLHVIFNTLCSVTFYAVYHEFEELSIYNFGQIALVHAIFSYGFKFIGEGKSISKTEAQLLAIGLVTLLFRNDVITQYLPLEIFQKLIISLIVSSLVVFPTFAYIPKILSAAVFAGTFYYLTVYQLYFVLKENAVVWLYDYIFNNEENFQIISIWLAILAVVIPTVFYNVDKLGVNTRRKVWHFLILIILLFNRDLLTTKIEFTLICILGAIVLFVITEMIRVNKITILGSFLYDSLLKFQDEKDLNGPLNLSYVYLVSGVAFPIVYDYVVNDKATIGRYVGLVGLGVGDAMASIVGRKYGTFKWRGSNKSIQGSIAFAISAFAAFYALDLYLTGHSGYVPVKNWENIVVVTILTAVLEGASDLNDNFLLPIVMPITLEVLNRCFD